MRLSIKRLGVLGGSVGLTLGVLAGGVGLGVVLNANPAPAATADPLEARIAELERVVVRDPQRPNTAVTDRLTAVEKSLRFSGNPDDLKTPDDLKQAIVKLSAKQDDLDRRLKVVEAADKPAAVSPTVDRDLRDLRTRVQDQKSDARALESRVHRLESRF